MLRIPNRQNLLPQLYCTEFSVQKIPTVYSNTIGALFLSSIRVQLLYSSQRELTNFLKISVLCRLFRSISVYCLQRIAYSQNVFSLSRMCPLVRLPDCIFRRICRIHLRGCQVGMPHHGLNSAHVSAVAQKMDRKRVAQGVWMCQV